MIIHYLLLFIILNLNLFSQNILIKSKITDINDQPISNASILCGKNGTISNYLGQFNINCRTDEKLIIKHISYELNELSTANVTQQIILNNKNILIETVLVNGGMSNKIKLNNIDIIKKSLTNNSNHHFEDIINSTPSLNYSSGTSRPRYFQIRGIGELSQFAGEGAPHFYISTIIDNIDFSGIGGVGILDDVNQIEIFKGPQSTFFGPNAMGGAINFTSNKPTSNESFKSIITMGNYNTSKISFVLNKPISDKLFFRTAVSNYKTDGFITNIYTNTDNTNGKDEKLFKLSLLRKPNNIKTVKYNLYLINLDNKYNQWTPDNNGYITYTDYQGYDRQKTIALSIKRIIKLNKGILTRISTYSNNNITYSYDGDWANNDYWSNPPYNWHIDNEDLFSEEACTVEYYPCYYDYSFPDLTNRTKKQKSKEIRYSNKNITVGGYFSELKEKDIRNGWIFAGADSINSVFKINNSSIYVQIKDKTKGKTKLNSTIRLDNFSTKNILSYRTYNAITGNYDYYNDMQTSISDSHIGISLNLIHKIDNSMDLFFNLSNGYKTAGINQSPNFSMYRYYDTEKATNIEIGYQLKKNNFSMDITSFYIKRINPQFRVFGQLNTSDPTSFDYGTINGVKGYSKGIEASFVKVMKIISISNSFSLLYTHLNEVTINPFSNLENASDINCGGRENAHAPKIKHNINIQFNLSNWINGLFYNIESSYSDEFYFDDQNENIADSRQIINSNVKYTINNNFNFNFWVKNLTNEVYQDRGYTFALDPTSQIRDYQSYNDKRSFGITIEIIK